MHFILEKFSSIDTRPISKDQLPLPMLHAIHELSLVFVTIFTYQTPRALIVPRNIELTLVHASRDLFVLHDSHVPSRMFEFSAKFVTISVRLNTAVFLTIDERPNVDFSGFVSDRSLEFCAILPVTRKCRRVILVRTPAMLQTCPPLTLINFSLRFTVLEDSFATRPH